MKEQVGFSSNKNESKESEPKTVLYRYQAAGDFNDKNRHHSVSHEDLVGTWFTDSVDKLKTYIIQRNDGGKILSVSVPAHDLEKYKAKNHPIAKDMDIDPDEFVLPKDIVETAQSSDFKILPEGKRRFNVLDFSTLDEALKDLFK